MSLKTFGKILAASLVAVLPAGAQTNVIQFQSAPERTALLELYTSEGCSSCPPAEAWLSGLKDSPRLWKDFAPVAFHVDYWNSPGWKDAWSDAKFSERQSNYARLWHSENIYTPELVLNGKEWQNWFTGKNGLKSDGNNVGVLTVTSSDMKLWQVSFNPAKDSGGRYEIHAALLAGGIVSDVKAGENSGRQLRHDFAVVSLVHIGLMTGNGVAKGRFILSAPKSTAGKTSAFTVWVTRAGELEPIQATGGWLTAPDKK
ncbi:MAG TPA: DUF1223 domain-containing protein [Dongiaceae bacterium]|jgi:hypothetical protein|nr:DUF1223 domain-containing protein [Dongiaceae bacterium]